jgi:hypothetical protein
VNEKKKFDYANKIFGIIIYQYGVPTIVFLFSFASIFAQNPKSVILTVPFTPRRTLSDLNYSIIIKNINFKKLSIYSKHSIRRTLQNWFVL